MAGGEARLLLTAQDQTGPAIEQAKRSLQGLQTKAVAVSGETANAMRMIGPQITDIVTGLASGQAPLTVLIQQGGQLKDMFGGVGAAARAVTGYISGLVSPLTLAAAGVGALAFAYIEGAKEAEAYARAVILSGNAAGTTTGQLQIMADRVSAVVGTTSKAAEVLAMLAASGRIRNEDLQQFAILAVRLDRVGISAKESVSDLAALGKDPVQASLRLNEAMNYLEVGTLRQIKALADLGKTQEAGELAQHAYAAAQTLRGEALERGLSDVGRLWKDVGEEAARAWDRMKGVGRADDVNAELQKVEAEIAKAMRQFDAMPGVGNAEARAKLQQNLIRQRQLKAQQDMQESLADLGRVRQEKLAAEREFSVLTDQSLSRQERTRKEQDRARELGAKLLGTTKADGTLFGQADIDKVLGNIGYEDTKRGIEAQIERLKTAQQIVDVRAQAAVSELQALRAIGAINERGFIEQSADVEIVAMAKRRGALEQEIRLKGKERESEKEVQALIGQRDVLDEQIFARTAKRENDLKTFDDQRAKAIDKVTQAEREQADADKEAARRAAAQRYSQAEQQVLGYARAIDDANEQLDFEVGLLGKTIDEQAKLNEQRRIELQLREQKRRIDERARGGNLTADEVKELNAGAEAAAAKALSKIDTRLYIDKWKHANETVGESLYLAITGRGKSAADKLKSLFEELVLKPTIMGQLQPISGTITNVLMGGSPGQQPAGAPPGAGSILGNILPSGFNIGGFGASQFGFLGTVAMGGAMVGSTIGQMMGLKGAQMQVASIGGSLIGGIPGALLGSLIAPGGGPKAEGVAGPGMDWYHAPNHSGDAQAEQLRKGLQDQFNAIASALGVLQSNITIGVGFGRDPQGTARSSIGITANRGSSILADAYSANVGRSDEEFQQAFAAYSNRVMLRALQAADIGGVVGDYLKSLGDMANEEADKAAAALARVQKIASEKATLDEVWFQLTSNDTQKLAHAREKELSTLDDLSKAQAYRIYALQDEIAAQKKADEATRKAAQSAKDAADFITGVRLDIGSYLDRLNATPAGLLSPEEQVANARSQFERQLGLALGGDRKAAQGITGYADQLAQAQIAYSASSAATQATLDYIRGDLAKLPEQLRPEQFIAESVSDGADQITGSIDELIARADANSKAQIDALNGKIAADKAALAVSPTSTAVTAVGAARQVVAPIYDPNSWEAMSQRASASYDVGTNYVPFDMTARIHKGERITPASENPYANPYRADRAVGDERLHTKVDRVADMVGRLVVVVAESARRQIELQEQMAGGIRGVEVQGLLAKAAHRA